MSKKQAKDGRICANCKRFVWVITDDDGKMIFKAKLLDKEE